MPGQSDRIIAQLKIDHRNMASLLRFLVRELESYRQSKQIDSDLVSQIMDYIINYPDMWHHPREDIIFRQLLLRCPETSTLVNGLLQEHRDLAAHNRRLAAALRNLSMDAEMPREWLERQITLCISQSLEHMRKEDEFYFPLALRVLQDEDWRSIEAEVGKISDDPLFGDKVRVDYLTLHERISAAQFGAS